MEKDIGTPVDRKSSTKRILEAVGLRLLQAVALVSLFGLALGLAGIVFEHQGLYKWGLRLAAPLYIIVLPLCLLLVVLFLVASCIMLVQDIRRMIRRKTGGG